MKRYLLIAAIGMSFIPLRLDITELVDKLTTYSLQHPQEKIFVHFDKPNYSTGETIWFKAYLVDALSNLPVSMSNVVYVELLSAELNILDKKILKIENGGSAGSFLLPDSLSPGNYHVRAYTNWMLNFDEAFLFRRSFRVLKTQTEEEYKKPVIKPIVNFFPEGGDLIEGATSIVAIKATDQFGRGLEMKGSFVVKGENTLNLETDKRGLGAIIYTPESNKKASAIFTFENRNYEFELPEPKRSGYNMRVINNYRSEKIVITASSIDEPLAGSGIIAHQNGEVFYSVMNQSNEKEFAVRLDRKDFPAGICHITFFDPVGRPRTERLIFANYPSHNEIKLRKKESYETRALVSLGLNVIDSANSIYPANLSVSITPRALVSVDESKSIINYLNLTSDLIGKIENPGFYLRENESSFKSLDLLMMTQGWRRFKWKDVIENNDQKSPEFWAEHGITFSGQIFDYYNRDLPRESQVSLTVSGQTFDFIEGETDEQGKFFFSGNDFYDSADLIFQAKRKLKRKNKEKLRNDVRISLDKAKMLAIQKPLYNTPPLYKLNKQDDYLSEKETIEKADRAFNFDKDAIMLDAVSVTGVREVIHDPFESVFKIYTDPTHRIVADSVMRGVPLINIYDLFRRIPGARVIGSFPSEQLQVMPPKVGAGGSTPTFLLDGVYINEGTLKSIPPSMISHVDVLKRADAAVYGSQGSNGVVAIYTKSGAEIPRKPKNMGILNHSHPGYSQVREFFAPNYAEPKAEHAKPDYRTTLYWNPTIITEGAGISELEFFSSDQKGTFDILIQGITAEGVPVFARDSLKVE